MIQVALAAVAASSVLFAHAALGASCPSGGLIITDGSGGGGCAGASGQYQITVINPPNSYAYPAGTQTISCYYDELLLDCAERYNMQLPYSSRAGAESSSTARLLSGTVDNSDQSYLDDNQTGAGYFLTDTAYPCSDLTFVTSVEEELSGGSCLGGGASVDCTFNGQTVANGASVTAYQSNQVPNGQTCLSETRTCNNGTLSGSYTFPACTVSFSLGATVQ